MSDLLKGKVAIVTGSGQGIGRAIAMALAKEGAKIVTNNRKPGSTKFVHINDEICANLTPERKAEFDKMRAMVTGDAESTAAAIVAAGSEALPVYGDIADSKSAKNLVDKCVEKFGTVDILVNVAGGFGGGSLHEISEEDWDRITLTKPKGYFNVMKYAIPYMREKKWGRILNCSSKAFMGDIISMAHYCTANAGAVGLTQAAATEYFHEGITANAFAPWARTRASYEGGFGPNFQGIAGQRPFPKPEETPEPDALAPFIVYLCTDYAKDITGTMFTLGGNGIMLHQFPIITKSISKPPTAPYWTVEEIHAKHSELFAGYKNLLNFI